jgi:hypothetical protein
MTNTSDVPGPDSPPPSALSPASPGSTLGAALRGNVSTEALRDAVCRYVDAARERGERVERVIISLKQEMRAAGVVDNYAAPKERALAEMVIRWCIERCYGRPARAD